MKKLEMNQMEKFEGLWDCSDESRLALVAGATIGGAILMGWGGLVTGYAAAAYTVAVCDN